MPPQKANPEDYARALLSRYKIEGVVALDELAQKIGLSIRELELMDVEGVLVRCHKTPHGIIGIKKNIREESRKRFCISHEIGHYILPGHGVTKNACKKEEMESFSKGVPEHEVEANRFAAELLMPTTAVASLVRQHSATIETAKIICEMFRTSLTASAIRCVDLTKEVCALVESQNGMIKRSHLNNQFVEYLRWGQPLSDDSLASRLSTTPPNLEMNGLVPASAWLNKKYGFHKEAKVWEDSILLPYYKTILSIITVTAPI